MGGLIIKKTKLITLFFIIYFIFCNVKIYAENDLYVDEWKIIFDDSMEYKNPKYDDSSWENITVNNHKVDKEKSKQNTNIWFRASVNIPSSYKSTQAGLYLGNITNGNETYINGHFIGKSLSSKIFFNDWNRRYAYYIPSEYINYDSENIIAIKSYCNYEYGAGDVVFISNYNRVLRKTTYLNTYYVCSFLGLFILLFWMFLYFFMLYKKTGIIKKYLYFSLICFFTSIYYTNYFAFEMPFNYLTYQKITFTSLHIFIILFLFFLKEFLNIKIYKWEKIICSLQFIVSVLGIIFIRDLIQYYSFRTILISMLSINIIYCLILTIYTITHSDLKTNKSVIRLTIALSLAILMTSNDFYSEIMKKPPILGVHLNGFSFVVLLLVISLDLVNEFNTMYINSNIDGMTKLYHQSYFKNTLNLLFESSKPEKQYSLIIFDIDHFKKFNDTYGHLVGDFVIKELAYIAKQKFNSKKFLICRYGGEEFSILLKNTSKENAFKLAEELRKEVDNHNFYYENIGSLHVTISVGVTSLDKKYLAEHSELFIKQSDMALYFAKEHGRNRVIHYETVYNLSKT